MDIRSFRADYFETVLQGRKGYSRVMDPICRQWDLTRNELDVILFLYNNPEFDRASDVAQRRGMAKSHVSMSVASLAERGLLERLESPEDRRAVRLQLSGEGKVVAADARQAQIRFFDMLYEGISEEELAVWEKITKKVCQNIENANK